MPCRAVVYGPGVFSTAVHLLLLYLLVCHTTILGRCGRHPPSVAECCALLHHFQYSNANPYAWHKQFGLTCGTACTGRRKAAAPTRNTNHWHSAVDHQYRPLDGVCSVHAAARCFYLRRQQEHLGALQGQCYVGIRQRCGTGGDICNVASFHLITAVWVDDASSRGTHRGTVEVHVK